MSALSETHGRLVAPANQTMADVIEVRGGPGRVSVGSLRELWVFRDVLGAFVVRQVKVKYKQAAIGIGWALIQPVASALLFALFLGHFTHLGSEGAPYVVFALAGTVAWSFFSNATGHSMESVVSDQMLLRKVYFPREILPLAAVLAALVDFVPALTTAVVACAIAGIHPSIAWAALPLPLLLLALTALGLGLGLSALNVFYRDVRYVLPFALQLGLFATPVVFSLSVVPAAWRTTYAVFNPVAAAVDALRRIIVHQTWPDMRMTLLAITWSVLLVGIGYTLFKRLEPGFSDRI